MNYRSINDLNSIIRSKLKIIPKDIDIIIGIPRSGMLPASIIALLLNKPLITLNELAGNSISSFSTRKINLNSEYKKALIIDDSCNTGYSIKRAKEFVDNNLSPMIERLYCAIYVTDESSNLVDLYFEICNQPRVFEWNIMNHSFIQASFMDLDGVLCFDPTDEQNDDGPKYLDFIKNAVPLFIPKYEIGAIVTSRLEKYREDTENWLNKNDIRFKNLIMLNVPDKETRQRLNLHAPFKAQVYMNSNAGLFIESNDGQARYISEVTNKPVYCTDSNKFYNRDNSFDIYSRVKALGKSIEKKAYDLLSIMYEFHGKMDYVILSDTEEAFSALKQYTSFVKSVFEEVNSFANENSNLKLWVETYCSTIEKLIANADMNSLKEFMSNIQLDQLEYLIDISIYGVVHNAAQKVSRVAWNEEYQRTVSELTSKFINGEEMISGYEKEIEFLKKSGKLLLYPYEFINKYKEEDVNVLEDSEKQLNYIFHNGKKLYFPKRSEISIAHEYNQLVMEQDAESPHNYFSRDCTFENGEIFVDVGAAEGIISLEVVEKAKEIYLIECSDEWISALKETFAPYKEKIHIIPKFAGRFDDNQSVTLDTLLSDYSDENIFIKMDTQGMELDILKSSMKVLQNNRCKLSCATCYTKEEAEELTIFFDNMGYHCATSDGYMLFYFGWPTLRNGKYEHIESPYFRKALVRAWK